MALIKWLAGALLAGVASSALAAAPKADPAADNAALRDLYREMVETDTSITSGSCTDLAGKIAGHLKAHGFSDAEIFTFATPEHPKEGGLVVTYAGTSAKVKPMLLLGHLDVVTAKRADWTRDPYKLIEENGYFYGRGTEDMKAMDAIWVDMLERFRASGYKPKRTIKLAMTCGEETSWAFNGAKWLTENKRELIDAEFVLNEGGGGRTDGHGKLMAQSVHVGEKTVGNYRIEATNPGGHSSAPVRENAIYDLAAALTKLRDHEFATMLSPTTRAFFAKSGAGRTDEMGKAMVTIASATPGSAEFKAAEAVLNTDKSYHSMLRTTCVATLLDGGHANNALPQRAGANINCRIFPGVSYEAVQKEITDTIGNPKMTVVKSDDRGPLAKAPEMTPMIMGPMEKLMTKHFPGIPLVPVMSTGATDGIFFEALGIPSYGPPGPWGDPDGNGTHGLNERFEVKALYKGRDYLTDLVKAYAG